jgi:hypothetical protein
MFRYRDDSGSGLWPTTGRRRDQDELADMARENLAREIEARRTGRYVLSDDEGAALEEARHAPSHRTKTWRSSGNVSASDEGP